MLGYLILLFTLVPLIELALLIKIGQYIGVANTIAIVILTGVTGAFLARIQGLVTLSRIQEEVNKGVMPADKLLDGVMILCSGILLLTPGLLTDIAGFSGLIPITRGVIKAWLKKKIKGKIDNGEVINITSYRSM